ncbi:MAG TPA: hypothetical protein VGR65_04575, partial [Casimicrobiaceae bacterium]|nr:hypothetical protein [Casimicrobiaceae bacterium]
AKSDVPYLIACTYLNAAGTRLWRNVDFDKLSAPCRKRNITWQEHIRATGEDSSAIANALCLEMFNAFGFRKVQ